MVSEKKLLNFVRHFDDVQKQINGRDPIIFLDYDGTLTPIVDTPDLAVLADDTRAILKELAQFYKVAIVSGRATDDVRSKVNIEKIFYAGSHGFEIVHPNGSVQINPEAQKMRRIIEEVFTQLSRQLKDVPGALVEDVKYTISVHYRLASEEDFSKIEQSVENVLKEQPLLRKTDGKKVFELRPDLDWDKGKAVEWILNDLQFDSQKNIGFYIGDDRTDEDAFKVLKDKGAGVLVADQPRPTEAEYIVKNVEEVKQTLTQFIALKK